MSADGEKEQRFSSLLNPNPNSATELSSAHNRATSTCSHELRSRSQLCQRVQWGLCQGSSVVICLDEGVASATADSVFPAVS